MVSDNEENIFKALAVELTGFTYLQEFARHK